MDSTTLAAHVRSIAVPDGTTLDVFPRTQYFPAENGEPCLVAIARRPEPDGRVYTTSGFLAVCTQGADIMGNGIRFRHMTETEASDLVTKMLATIDRHTAELEAAQ